MDKVCCDDGNEHNQTKKNDKLRINTNKCRGELKLIKKIIKKNKWEEIFDENVDIFWSGLNLHLDEYRLALKTKINRIPGMTSLAHKKTTAIYLNKFQEYFPENYQFYPKTFVIPEELDKFRKFIDKEGKICIAKPTAGHQGDGIYILQKYTDLPFVKNGYIDKKDYVVQTYLEKPLLIDHKKFDLRLYVLISSVKPFIAYLNTEGLARFCTENYQAPTSKNILNSFVHLSNYSLNKNNASYKFMNDPSLVTEVNEGSKRSLASFWKTMALNGIDQEKIMTKIEDLIVNFLTSIYPFILYNYKCVFGKKEGRCFHLTGFDIIIDEDLNPLLLEINANPSLSIMFDPNENDVKEENKEKEISFVDLHVKEKVVEDCLKILNMSIEDQQKIGKGNLFNSYKMLIEKDIQEESRLFKKLLEIFGYLSGYQFNYSLNISKFGKLGTINYMIDKGLNRHHLEIIFKKFVKNSNCMDFYLFIDAVELISSMIDKDYKAENKLPSVTMVIDNIFNELIVNVI